jgi:hypothetical protein
MTGPTSRRVVEGDPQTTIRIMYAGIRMIRVIAIVFFFSTLLAGQQKYIYWHSSYREALKEAAATKKPVFLEFRCEA